MAEPEQTADGGAHPHAGVQNALDAIERCMEEAERLAASGDMAAASRALNAAGRMRRLAKMLGERAAERSAREAVQKIDYLALLRSVLTARVEEIERRAAAAGADYVDEACETPECDGGCWSEG